MQEGFLFQRLITVYFDFLHCFSSFVIYLDMEWTMHDRVCLPFFLHKFFPVLFIGYSLLSLAACYTACLSWFLTYE